MAPYSSSPSLRKPETDLKSAVCNRLKRLNLTLSTDLKMLADNLSDVHVWDVGISGPPETLRLCWWAAWSILSRMLQLCLTVKLQKCFVDYDTSPDFPSESRNNNIDWNHIFWVNCFFNISVMMFSERSHSVWTCTLIPQVHLAELFWWKVLFAAVFLQSMIATFNFRSREHFLHHSVQLSMRRRQKTKDNWELILPVKILLHEIQSPKNQRKHVPPSQTVRY